MRNNAMNVDGVEVYLNNIYALADEFIKKELDGKHEDVHDNFLRMIFYIRDRIEKPSNDDIGLLNKIFDVFVHLCVEYQVLPTMECFSFLVQINKSTFTDWSNGEYRKSSAHGKTVKDWFETCRSFTMERLHNSGKTDVNLIFTAKAAYGMVETVPIQTANTEVMALSREEIRARYQALDEFKEAPGQLRLE